MAIDPSAAALIGAAVGAGGAIIAQVASVIFTGRSESRKFKWDREEAQAARFADIRLQLFTQILTDVQDVVKKLSDQYVSEESETDLDDTFHEWLHIHAQHMAKVSLIAPAVHKPLVLLVSEISAYKRILELKDDVSGGPNRKRIVLESYGKVPRMLDELRRIMRDTLGITGDHFPGFHLLNVYHD
jgi:hypothetical protein